MHHAQIVSTILSLKKTSPINPLVETAMLTVTLNEGCIFLVSKCLFLGTQNRTLCLFSKPSKWKCASSENHTLCTVISSWSAHTANCSLLEQATSSCNTCFVQIQEQTVMQTSLRRLSRHP